MKRYILLFIYLFSSSLSSYLPLKKHNGFDDNVCAYTFNDIEYVKTCKDKDKYCKYIGESTSFCEDRPTSITLKTLEEKCESKFECEDDLYCYLGQCSMSENSINICGTDQEPHKTQSGWECKDKAIADYCYYKDNLNYQSGTRYEPDYFKVCGEITFDSNTLTGNNGLEYFPVKIESAYIGTVEDGKYVKDALACKSGYALPFYPGTSLKDPSSLSSNKNHMFLRCVSVNGIDRVDNNNNNNNCVIKYDDDKIYNIEQLNGNPKLYPYALYGTPQYDLRLLYSGSISQFCDENLMTQLEIFSKYINVFNKEKQEQCAKKENYNEPYTCNDNELRKWFYYYNNPSHYKLYYDEDGNDVANYLIQKSFPLYESSKFISVKFLIGLLFLLLF